MVVKNFYETLLAEEKRGHFDASTLEVLRNLFRLFSLHTLEQESSEFSTTGACSQQQISLARSNTIMRLLKDIRPHAVRLVDAWALDDYLLDSSLGRYDGRVYEDMFYRASELNPLNRVTVDPYPDSEVIFKRVEGRSKL